MVVIAADADVGTGTRVPLISVHEERAGLHWIGPPNELPPVVVGAAVVEDLETVLAGYALDGRNPLQSPLLQVLKAHWLSAEQAALKLPQVRMVPAVLPKHSTPAPHCSLAPHAAPRAKDPAGAVICGAPEGWTIVPVTIEADAVVDEAATSPAVAVAQKSLIRAASSPEQVVRLHEQTTSGVPAAMHEL